MLQQPIEQHRWVVQVQGNAKTVHDRTFLVVDPHGHPMTARSIVGVQVDDVPLGSISEGLGRQTVAGKHPGERRRQVGMVMAQVAELLITGGYEFHAQLSSLYSTPLLLSISMTFSNSA